MPNFARLVVAITAVLALASPSALAAVDVEGNRVTFAWTPSAGPVYHYAVYLARNGGSLALAGAIAAPQVTVFGPFGDTVQVQVVARGSDGQSLLVSQPSLPSEVVRFVDPTVSTPSATPPPPQATPTPTPPPPQATPTPLPSPPPPPAGTRVMPYDFDGDGRTDILWRNRRTSEAAVWLMNGTSPSRTGDLGTLSWAWTVIGSGDFDGDRRADLLLHAPGTAVYEIWFMNGDSLREKVRFFSPSTGTTVEAIGDFDGDGYADLLWRWQSVTQFWFMRGATVDEKVAGPPVANSYSPGPCTPDSNGDGRSDLARSSASGTSVWLMDGASVSRSGAAAQQLPAALVRGCGDADGDGYGDLLWYQAASRRAVLWAMDGDTGVDFSLELPTPDAGWILEASGDFDGDGRANDVLIRDATSGSVEIWELRWDGTLTSFSVFATSGTGMGSGDWEAVAP